VTMVMGFWGLAAAYRAGEKSGSREYLHINTKEYRHNFWLASPNWIALGGQSAFTVAGLIGLVTLVKENWSQVFELKAITIVFGVIVGGCFLFLIMMGWARASSSSDNVRGRQEYPYWISSSVIYLWLLLLQVLAMYSDFTLGSLAGDITGVHSGNKIYYWIYFIAKRLLLFLM